MNNFQEHPFVTVIMPIRNEADFIERSLGAVLDQDYPHHCMEVLIADGMSDDGTREIVRKIAARTEVTVKVLVNPARIVPTGFNTALRRAHGEIIVRVDGHTIIEADYITQCVKELQRRRADNVGGRMHAIGKSPFGEAVASATSSFFGVGGSRFHYSDKEEYVDTVYMGAWWKDIFYQIGFFDEELVRNQDDEFNYRLRANGKKILLSPAIKSTYFNRSTISGLWRQYYQYGLYKVRVMQKHPRQMRPRQFAPLILVTVLLGSGILSLFNLWLRRLWLISLVTYSAANFTVSILTARRAGWRHLRFLSIVFATLHFSYGLGFLHGLIKFRNRWKEY